MTAAIVAGVAVASTPAPALATSISEFSAGITSPGGQITYGADGNTWFTEPTSPNRIGKTTPAGVVTEYTTGLSLNAGLAGITAGPDGNVWFTESIADKIGRITPGGVVTEFAGGVGGTPMGIAAGPDGNLWFTEPKVGPTGSDEIGRMSTTGTLGTITTGVTDGSTPMAITAGSDGNMWFTEQNGGRIGKVTIPADTISEFADSLSPQNVHAIASGGDGNLWVTETAANKIARVTTAGVATQFSAGITAASQPAAITSGPDGSTWFTETSGNRIGRITPPGTVTEYTAGITPGAFPQGIVMGSDLNLWFTESAAPRIGMVYQPGIRGIDVLNFNGSVNWSQVAGAGYSFGYAKLTESNNYIDPTFTANWNGMKAAGMSRGAYLFFRPNVDPTAQVDFFLAHLPALTSKDLVPMIDVEVTDGLSPALVAARLRTAVDRMRIALDAWPVIYTSAGFWTTSVGNPTTFSADPLWIANWLVRSPQVPASNWGGQGWSGWQYTSSGVVPGIFGPADIDQAGWRGLPLMGSARSVNPTSQSPSKSPATRDATHQSPSRTSPPRVPSVGTAKQMANAQPTSESTIWSAGGEPAAWPFAGWLAFLLALFMR